MIRKDDNKTSVEKTDIAKKIANKRTVKTTFGSVEEGGLRFSRWISSVIDTIFFNDRYLILASLLGACLIYFTATYDTSATLASAVTLSNVSVNTRYNSETFELSGAPTSCQIVLTGEAGNVNNASSKKGGCQINLEGYTEGTHNVKVNAVGYGDNVTAIVSPSEVTVTLKKKTTMQFDLRYDYINQNSLDARYILGAPTFNFEGKINIRASQDTLNSISMVKALIDVAGQTSDFVVEAPLVAYDSKGQVVTAEIVPSTVSVNVSISSPSNEVPIVIRTNGSTPNGISIDSIVITDHQTTRIYAPDNILSTVSQVYVDIDLSTIGASENEIMLPLTLPSNINASDVTYVNVKVNLATVESRVLEDIPVQYINNYNNLAAKEIDYQTIDVTLSGSETNINAVDKDDIVVYFEMPSEPGTYNLPIYVQNDKHPYVNAVPVISHINITVVEAN